MIRKDREACRRAIAHVVGANVSTKAAKAAASAHRVSQNAL
jgi:hypothetical protein